MRSYELGGGWNQPVLGTCFSPNLPSVMVTLSKSFVSVLQLPHFIPLFLQDSSERHLLLEVFPDPSLG